MNRFIFCLLIFIKSTLFAAAPLPLHVDAEAAILMNADTGAILYQKNPHKCMNPASVTKVATALYTLKLKGDKPDEMAVVTREALAPTTMEAKKRSNFTLPSHWLEPESTLMGVKLGEELTIRDLMYGLMLRSGNDAANTLALHICGSVPRFMEGMNGYLKEIGCKHTIYHNPHGLYHPNHQTTAYDLAIMMSEGLKYPLFTNVISCEQYLKPKSNLQEADTMVQKIKMFKRGKYYYPKIIGGKRGYIGASGRTFVCAARDGKRTLIAVLLKSKEWDDVYRDTIKMFNAAFDQKPVEKSYLKAGRLNFVADIEGAAAPVPTYLNKDLAVTFYPAEEPEVNCLLYWDQVTPPIAQNQRIGELRLKDARGEILAAQPLYADAEVGYSFIYRVTHPLVAGGGSWIVLIFLSAAALYVLYRLVLR